MPAFPGGCIIAVPHPSTASLDERLGRLLTLQE